MPRPYRVPFGLGGAVALSVPPVLLCALSIWLADEMTTWVSLAGMVLGLIVFPLTAHGHTTRERAPSLP
jgi:hypothetical protein